MVLHEISKGSQQSLERILFKSPTYDINSTALQQLIKNQKYQSHGGSKSKGQTITKVQSASSFNNTPLCWNEPFTKANIQVNGYAVTVDRRAQGTKLIELVTVVG